MCNTQKRRFLRIASSITLLEAALFIVFNVILVYKLPEDSLTEITTTDPNISTTVISTKIPSTVLTSTTNGTATTDATTLNSDDFFQFFQEINNIGRLIVEELALKTCYCFNITIDSIWLLISLTLLIITSRKNLYNGSYMYLLPWIVVTVLVCCTDVIEVAYYMATFRNKVEDKFFVENDVEIIMKALFLPLFFAKAIVILCLNIVLAVLMSNAYKYLRSAHERSIELEDYELKDSVNGDGSNYQSLDKLKKEDYPPPVNEYDNYAFENDLPERDNKSRKNGSAPNERPVRPPSLDTAHYINHNGERKRQQTPSDNAKYYDNNFSLKTKSLEDDLQHKKISTSRNPVRTTNHRNSIDLVNPRLKTEAPSGKSALNFAEDLPPKSRSKLEKKSSESDSQAKQKKPKSVLKAKTSEPIEDPLLLPHIKSTTIPEDKYSIPRVTLKKY